MEKYSPECPVFSKNNEMDMIMKINLSIARHLLDRSLFPLLVLFLFLIPFSGVSQADNAGTSPGGSKKETVNVSSMAQDFRKLSGIIREGNLENAKKTIMQILEKIPSLNRADDKALAAHGFMRAVLAGLYLIESDYAKAAEDFEIALLDLPPAFSGRDDLTALAIRTSIMADLPKLADKIIASQKPVPTPESSSSGKSKVASKPKKGQNKSSASGPAASAGPSADNINLITAKAQLAMYNKKFHQASSMLTAMGTAPKADPFHLAIYFHVLGQSRAGLDDLEGALDRFKKAATLLRGARLDNHPEMAYILLDTARIFKKKENYNEALKLQKKSLEIMTASLGAIHKDTARVHAEIAGTLRNMGKVEEAITSYDLGRDIQSRAIGKYQGVPMNALNISSGLLNAEDIGGPVFMANAAIDFFTKNIPVSDKP